MAQSRSKRLLLLSMLGGVLGIAVIAQVVGALQGKPAVRVTTTTAPPATTTTVVALAPLGEEGAELDALGASGRSATYHAVYGVEDSEIEEGILQSVEVWRKGPQYRFDIIERASNGTRRQSTVFDGTSRRYCETLQGTQTCRAVDYDPVDLLVQFIRDVSTKKPKLTAHDEQDIAGYQARCFTAKDVGEACVTTDGVLLKVKLKTALITATRLEDEVPDTAFDVQG